MLPPLPKHQYVQRGGNRNVSPFGCTTGLSSRFHIGPSGKTQPPPPGPIPQTIPAYPSIGTALPRDRNSTNEQRTLSLRTPLVEVFFFITTKTQIMHPKVKGSYISQTNDRKRPPVFGGLHVHNKGGQCPTTSSHPKLLGLHTA